MDLGLKGKTAIVIGGSTGIGRAVTEMLAEEGCNVAICDIEPREAAEAFARSVTISSGTECIAVYADISAEEDVALMEQAAIDEFGGYDIMINCAAATTTAMIEDLELKDWERVIGVNLTGAYLISKAAIRHFMEKGAGGRIINFTSQSAFRGTKSGHAHYAASKAGVVGLTRTLALETAKHGICVNVVSPGIVNTAMMEERINSRREQYEAEIPLGYVAEPKDVAYAVVFLASDMGKYITGATLDVSGGIMLR
ncbi:MAG: SDR family oxidoreductase [Clostridiales bacterium]|nr:SDR family oxidoreductase [Clostridiales bacterium]